MESVNNKPPLVTGQVTYEIKDGILFIERGERSVYTEEIIKSYVAKRQAYTEGRAYPCIIFGKDLLSLDKGARGYLAGEGSKYVISRAFVVEQSQGKLAINFFIGTNKLPVPTKVFEDLDEAIEWSKQFRASL